MAIQFVPEDGTGLANATTYVDEATADQYLENTGRRTTWRGFARSARQAALNFAAQYMDDRYGKRYLGDIQESTAETQALLWPREKVPSPRTGALLTDPAFPAEIGEACAEFALALLKDGNETLFGTDEQAGPTLNRKLVRVEGAVTKDEEFRGSSTSSNRNRRYPQAEAVLRPYLSASLPRVMRA